MILTPSHQLLADAAEKAVDVVDVAALRAEVLLKHTSDIIAEDTAERAANKAISKFFEKLGVDVSDTSSVIQMQKDFAHLRTWRESVDSIKQRGMAATITALVTGVLGILYAFFSNKF